jgi:hypothetical protein
MYDSEPRRQRRGISFLPILIIILGIVFLLNNFAILPWEIWQNLWKFWPILLILLGVEVLLGRTSSFRTVILLLGLIFLVPVLLILNPLTGNPLASETTSLEKPLGNLTKSEVVLDLPSNNLKISALPRESDKAFKTSVKYSKLLPKPEIVEDRRFDEAKYTFKQPEKYLPFSANLGNSVDLSLSSLLPNYILVRGNAGVFSLDLSSLNVPALEIETGAAQIEIIYPKASNNKTFIKTAASKITLKIPNESEADIKVASVVENIKVDQKRFTKNGDHYSTAGFAGAQSKLQIEISGQASSVEVK